MITENQAERINRMHPEAQRAQLGTEIYNLSQGSAIEIPILIDQDGTAGIASTIPVDMRVTDVVAEAHATVGGGTATLRIGTTAISNSISMDTDNTVVRASTIDRTVATLSASNVVNVITTNVGDRGLVTVRGYRL